MILDHHPSKPHSATTASSALFDMLLDANAPTKFVDSSSSTSHTTEEDDLMLLNDVDQDGADDVLMSSISLDDSSSMLSIGIDDDDEDEDEEDEQEAEKSLRSVRSVQSVIIPEETLYNAKEQRFEWDEDFSMLKKLRRTQLAIVFEDQEF